MGDVTLSGPFFERRDEIIGALVRRTQQDVARAGEGLVQDRLSESIRVNTGEYQRHIHTQRQGLNLLVTDGGVVYGPWLEGVGSRNFPHTRFKGYSSFRIATQELDQQVPQIVEPAVKQAVTELNGKG